MTVDLIKQLSHYNEWANGRLLDVVATLPDDQFARSLNSSHGGIRGTLTHLYGAEQIWLDRWNGTNPTALVTEQDIPTFSLLSEKWNALRPRFAQFVESLTDERLRTPLTYRDLKGNEYTQPLWQQMLHLFNHSTYHRGQVVALLRIIGVKPVNTDLITYYRKAQQ